MNEKIIPEELNLGVLIKRKKNVESNLPNGRLKLLKKEKKLFNSAAPNYFYIEFTFLTESEYLKNDFEISKPIFFTTQELYYYEVWDYNSLELVKYIEKLQFDDSVIFNDDISKFDLLEMIIQKAKEL